MHVCLHGDAYKPYLDTWWHCYVKVTQYMLCVLVFGALPQKGQKPSGILVTISDLWWMEREKEGQSKMENMEKENGGKGANQIEEWKREAEQRSRKRGNEERDRAYEKRRERRNRARETGEEEGKQIKTGIRSLHNVSSMRRSNMGREAGGNRDGSSPQAGERERFTCTFYLDVCQTRQLQSDREREKERQWDRHVQTGKATR